VDLGGVTLEAAFQPVPRRVVAPIGESLDYTALNIFLVMFFAATAFVITAMNRPGDDDMYADELSADNARIAKLIIKPPEAQKNKFLERLNQQKEAKKSGEMAAKSRGDEGQMGKKDAAKTNNRTAPKGDPSKKDEARALTAKIFGSGKGGISTVFGKNGLGGDLKSAMGNMFGNKTGDSGGFGGLGLRGSGGGGGGTGDSIGIGGIGTKGRGGGTGTYGNGVGVLGGKQSVDVGITSSEPEVMGSLDKELIRKVIQMNRGQIRYCYESLLNRFPKLGGKVSVKFVITATGSVASSSVAQSTAGNAELETCVAGRVRTWKFPEPKGGGVVVVTYPFIFKQAGE
jgi:TonB family protein